MWVDEEGKIMLDPPRRDSTHGSSMLANELGLRLINGRDHSGNGGGKLYLNTPCTFRALADNPDYSPSFLNPPSEENPQGDHSVLTIIDHSDLLDGARPAQLAQLLFR